MTNEKTNLENERAQLLQDNEHLQVQVKEKTDELDVKNARNEELENKQRGIDHMINDLKMQLNRSRNENKNIKSRFEDEKKTLKMDMDKVEKDNKDLRQRYARINAEVLGNVDSSEILENIMTNVVKKNSEGKSSDERIIALEHKIESLELDIKGKEIEFRKLQRENESLQNDNKELTKQLNEWKGEKALFEIAMPETPF